MQLFLTSVLPFLAHDHPSAVAFLTCRYHNFHASIIPEFLSDEKRVKSFCCARQQNQVEPEEQTPHEDSCKYTARQQNQLKADEDKQVKNLYKLFVQTPLMQFSPSLLLWQEDCSSILKPLLATKYFTRTLQRCSVVSHVPLTLDLLQSLSKVQSLTNLDLGWSKVENQHLEIIIHSFPSLETLVIQEASCLRIVTPSETAIKRTLRNLTLNYVDALFVTQFVSHFPNLRKLKLGAKKPFLPLNQRCLSSSLPLMTHLELERFTLENSESLSNCADLSALHFERCHMSDLSFLTRENGLPELATLRIESWYELSTSTSFASLAHAQSLRVLKINSRLFDNGCLQYLENMIHLRELNLSFTGIVGDSRSLKTLMQNLFQLEELTLFDCRIGNQGAIAGALHNTHNRLRVLNLRDCDLVDDDLNGIGALKNTLEVLDLSQNDDLTNEALVHCRELVKLKVLKLYFNSDITDLSPLEACLSLEELGVVGCHKLKDLVKLKSWKLRRCLGIKDQ